MYLSQSGSASAGAVSPRARSNKARTLWISAKPSKKFTYCSTYPGTLMKFSRPSSNRFLATLSFPSLAYSIFAAATKTCKRPWDDNTDLMHIWNCMAMFPCRSLSCLLDMQILGRWSIEDYQRACQDTHIYPGNCLAMPSSLKQTSSPHRWTLVHVKVKAELSIALFWSGFDDHAIIKRSPLHLEKAVFSARCPAYYNIVLA